MQSASMLEWTVWRDVGIGAANGLVVAVLVTGALPLFENLFGVVTPLKLLELSNPNHPLLKKLMVEAPGSYHHTILVANLCEAAAESIGADQVLARVGAYYHDIGKTKRPAFFVENQFGGENPHDKLPPSLSAMIITSHVKEGVEMAKEARLPQEIIDFIPEHHGTTLVSYFYHMASKNGQSEFVLEEDFRYDGPKPRRKETAICMLADGCEASVRAMRQRGHLTHDQIEQQVKRIIDDRLKQGQLDNCDLTLKELDTIARTFVKVLSGVHHARIDYPAEAKPAGAAQTPPPPPVENPAEEKKDATPARAGAEEANSDGDLDQQRTGQGNPDGGAGGDGP
jgi:putative nucleotidyltransferase with HDIG domain